MAANGTGNTLEFSEAEIAEARRLNRRLAYMPRFRAPGAFGKFMIQSMMRVGQAVAPRSVSGVFIRTQRLRWKDQDITLRTLIPDAPARGVYIDYHGGGWSIGNAAMDDPVNLRIAKECGLAVVSVDYDLMPDTRLPQMIAQCAAAADWVFENGETEFGAAHIFIGGESAGAHLAACTVLALKKARQDFDRLKGAVLFYGVYDLSSTTSVRNAARDALVLHGPAMRTGLASLAPERDEAGLRDPALSPLYADLTGLPPALLLCGAIDPLIDDTRLMADRWSHQSGDAQTVIAPDAPHAFNRFPASRMASRTNAFVLGWLDARLAEAPHASMAAE